MNLLGDDTRIDTTQYRVGFNVRNRYDVIDPINSSSLDTHIPVGVIQEHVTFGNYVIAFVAGSAYYRLYNQVGWTKIARFSLSPIAPRYWTCVVPVGTTNYVRQAATLDSRGNVTYNNLAGAAAGNLPGLLVQDNINQPQFIFLANSGSVQCRTTQTFAQWNITYTDGTRTVVVIDAREYVPIGNVMAFVDGILYVASVDGNSLYRSVSGRPLDFVVNVATTGLAGGDATTTSYSVGVGGIASLRAMSDGSLFVGASNANFSVAKNMSQNAPTLWGEYSFIRKYLFEATCLNDRCIIDSLGDTRFIDLTGVRSFNAIEQLQNEGRNSAFTATIQAAFKNTLQDTAAAILFDNYELYAVNTVFGPAIAVYDTITGSWSSFDTTQTSSKKIKQFAKIELSVHALFAITEDDKLYQLYSSAGFDNGAIVTAGISSNLLYLGQNVKLNNAKFEIKPMDFRVIVNRITQDGSITLTPFVNNRQSTTSKQIKKITYAAPVKPYAGTFQVPDADTQLTNVYFPTPDIEQGWKVSYLIEWTGGSSITQFSSSMKDETPRNPLLSQGVVN